MDKILLEGLSISLTAMLLTFVALGLFILVMIALQALFPAEDVISEAKTAAPDDLAENAEPCGPTEEEAELVAAIAAAVSYVRVQAQAGLGKNLQQRRGGWWSANYQRKPQKR